MAQICVIRIQVQICQSRMLCVFLSRRVPPIRRCKHESPKVVERWIQHFLAVLREFDLMEKSPRTNLKKPLVRKEVFAFFCIWLLNEGISGIQIFNSLYGKISS